MSRRYGARVRCAEEGCPEWFISSCSNRQQELDAVAFYRVNPWRCIRHSGPDKILSADNSERTATVIAQPSSAENAAELAWREEGERVGTGFIHGPGFKAWANDFPPGTRLIITARIELPESEGQR